MFVRCCLGGITLSTAASRHDLGSAASHQFIVPSYCITSYRCRAFSVTGPMMCRLTV